MLNYHVEKITPNQIISESTPIIPNEYESIKKSHKCCQKYYPRLPYTHLNYLIDDCINMWKLPSIDLGVSSPHPTDKLIFCFPCALVGDVLCCIPMIFGCYKIEYIGL